ncbi:indolepyruvate oxidoreductase subunit beta family protein [Phenylobacterium sp. LjRoot225]|uniref:indolepyruvate oxidoreductase subunit beta family protein n=1 Tax=Phenylobacterium sp. LjRoot225 TaxID=3342285 RepID=UPI003ECDC920
MPLDRDRITVAILALGGQGGGVLAEWIREVAADNGYIAQATSVPGVAQRTGSTVYYIEMIRRPGSGANHPDPVLALTPVPGDVDIVVASELMEGGRAMLRGFVTADRTTLISSTHRIYAISEKSAAGDGVGSSARIIETARRRARRFVGFDMEQAANRAGSVISSVMLGALAGSRALPFAPEAFEAAIRQGGKAVEANLNGFASGLAQAQDAAEPASDPSGPSEPTTLVGQRLLASVRSALREPAHAVAIEGVRRLMDYQDAAYADLYLKRLAPIAALDATPDAALSEATARWLALWMAYEDTIRVADLKIRATRSARVANDVRVKPGQVMTVTEYMHPRLQEVCDVLPARLGAAILRSKAWRRATAPLFAKGRYVRSTSLTWFLALAAVAALRPIRRASLRFAEEQARIDAWLTAVDAAAQTDPPLALELAAAPRLIKGYSDTFDRGLARFRSIMQAAEALRGDPLAAAKIRALREAALADDSDAPSSTSSPLTIERSRFSDQASVRWGPAA